MRYTRMYADRAGETYFDDVEVAMTPGPVQPLVIDANLGAWMPAEAIRFLENPPGLAADHPAEGQYLFITLSGGFRVTVRDGETGSFGGGDVGLAEDTTGKGGAKPLAMATPIWPSPNCNKEP